MIHSKIHPPTNSSKTNENMPPALTSRPTNEAKMAISIVHAVTIANIVNPEVTSELSRRVRNSRT